MTRSGDMPLVICSGWSVNALRNPFLFFSRYKRAMNASEDAGFTLRATCEMRHPMNNYATYLSACKMRMPVIK